MVNRIEPHDIINAVGLAVVLLFCVFITMRWLDFLGAAWDEGFIDAEEPPTLGLPVDDAAALASEIRGQHVPNEVTVLVGNGSDGIDGLAGRGTDRLGDAGYGTLTPRNVDGPAVAISTIYFTDGYRPDALAIAILLGFTDDQVKALTESPGVPVEGADIIVVLGDDAGT